MPRRASTVTRYGVYRSATNLTRKSQHNPRIYKIKGSNEWMFILGIEKPSKTLPRKYDTSLNRVKQKDRIRAWIKANRAKMNQYQREWRKRNPYRR